MGRRRIDEWFCSCCGKRILAPRGKKETSEEKAIREAKNEENTLICRIIIIDGKVVEEFGYVPYYFEGRAYHYECLLKKLRTKFKKDEKKVSNAMKKIEEARDKKIDDARKKGILRSSEMENAKSTRDGRERLKNYFMGHYATSVLTKKILSTIKNLNDGKSSEVGTIQISYEKLLDMFLYYEKDLMSIAQSKQKRGEGFVNPCQHILYDISVVVANIDDYNNRKVAIYTQQAQQDERGEILDVKKYRLDLQNRNDNSNKEKKIDESLKRAIEFAEEYTKEYEEDKYNYGIFDGIFDD